MKRVSILALAAIAVCAIALISFAASRTYDEAAPIFGIKIPPGYRDWRLISVAHEAGNLNDLRAVLGNDVAIKAYREGKLPLPDGAIIARLAWRAAGVSLNSKTAKLTTRRISKPVSLATSRSKIATLSSPSTRPHLRWRLQRTGGV